MNEKFFTLPIAKQQAIINAGYRIFSQNSYKNSPVSQIAQEAGISKSLLFYYFKNKKDLYLYLWEYAAQITIQFLTEYGCYEEKDLFESMKKGMKAKIDIMRLYPNITSFTLKAFFEKDDDIRPAIQESYQNHLKLRTQESSLYLDPEQFIDGLDLKLMVKEMYLASQGYVWEMVHNDKIDVNTIEEDFSKLIDFWKNVYLKKKE